MAPQVPGRPVAAQRAPAEPTGEQLVRTELLATHEAIRAGEPFRLALVFTIEPNWHVYWKNPGDSGSPIRVSITLPEGFVAGPLEWPAPQLFEHPGDVTFGYSGTAVLFVPVTPPGTLAPSAPVEFAAEASWLVCRDKCLFGKRTHRLALPVAPGTRPDGQSPTAAQPRDFGDERLKTGLARLARPAQEVGLTARLESGVLVVEGPVSGDRPVRLFPLATPGVDYPSSLIEPPSVHEGRFRFSIPIDVNPQNSLGEPLRVAGSVVVGDAAQPHLYAEFEVPVDR